jgi:RNA polymerase sigma factor (TIGR02999 family)
MAQSKTHEVTTLLQAWGRGEDAALDEIIPIVYRELRRIAHRYMAGERPDHTLQTTALVNEAYLKLVDSRGVNWRNRAHFFAISAQLMRRILVDYARARGYRKRGGGVRDITLRDELAGANERARNVLDLDDALKALAELDPRKSKVVELRFFGGLSLEETAEVLKVCPDTVLRDWRMAKAWLGRELGAEKDHAT